MLVVTRYQHSARHQRTYAQGTQVYDRGALDHTTLRRSFTCECGEWVDDGERICSRAYDNEGRVVHVNCCTDHPHKESHNGS